MKKTKGFGLLGIIIIIIVTAIISCVATGVIMLNNNSVKYVNSLPELADDAALREFVEVYQTLTENYYEDIDNEELLNAAKNGMSDYLGEKYTTFLGEAEYDKILQELSGTYNGIGITIRGNEIVSITLNSPAEIAGLQIGDIILKVNGQSVIEMSSQELGNLIKNNTSKLVSLEINRNDETIPFTIEKKELPTIIYYKLENTDIGYILIENFSQSLSSQVREALKALDKQKITGLIIDVRDNAGGYLSAAEETASLFIEKGKVIYSLESNSSKYTYYDKTSEKTEYPIAVLTNGNSASASEILAAALKESYNAFIVGTKTYGKGKVQQVVDSFKFTSAKWLTPYGTCIDGIGITPNYVVELESGEVYDSQISKAIEILK